MINEKKFNFNQTSKSITEIGDVILKARKNKNIQTRQVLSARIIDNFANPICSIYFH